MTARLIAGPPHAISAALPTAAVLKALTGVTAPFIAVAVHDDGPAVLHDCASATEAYALKKRLGVADLRIV